ncbi:MAG TPA: MafI family immunity protein [Polyangia bacterium]|nr:MafI family immunity protein [Polyangia bacterium]
MELNEIERRLSLILQASAGWLPDEQLQDVIALVRAGEPGVALENYLTQLFEYDVTIPREVFRALRGIGEEMGIDPKYWKRLAPEGESA